jgi:hypothetical protein
MIVNTNLEVKITVSESIDLIWRWEKFPDFHKRANKIGASAEGHRSGLAHLGLRDSHRLG